MDFGLHREGFVEEDQIQTGKAKLQCFSYSSSSSPSSSSSHHYRNQMIPPGNSRWEPHHHQQMGSWFGPSEEDHNSRSNNEETASAKLDLMETSPTNDEDVRTSASVSIEKEHMFDKVVTPSDVGKLNRLVIPKQHAEKYFPLDSSTNEKGLLLNFEDRSGKPWRFRYSYWNSSQSYVMTKGWSRFVKDKKLDAGDIVSFQRGVGELGKDRLYIDWRRRPDAPEPSPTFPLQHHLSFHHSIPWSPLLMRPPILIPGMARDHSHLSQINTYLNRNSYYNGGGYGNNNVVSPCSMGSNILYLRSQPAVNPQVQVQMGMVEWQQQQQQQQQQQHPVVFDSVPVVQGKAAAKRLRLFGVNMECPMTESDECDILSSTTMTIQQQPSQLPSSSQSPLPLQLRLYNGTPMPAAALPPIDFLNIGNASMSFDSGI